MAVHPDTEELRLEIAHLRRAIAEVATLARNSLKAASKDPEDWRADMRMVAERLEGRLST